MKLGGAAKSLLMERSTAPGVSGRSVLDAVERGVRLGLVPMICETPLRYDRWMFSLLGEGDRCSGGRPALGGKKGETLDSELSPGESIDGLLGPFDMLSDRFQGPVDRWSDTAERTGDALSRFWPPSCFPSA